MHSLSVVEDLNPFCNQGLGTDMIMKLIAVNQFSFEGAEKTFSHCIIPTTCPPAHAVPGVVGFWACAYHRYQIFRA
jgi:hypothetical protein